MRRWVLVVALAGCNQLYGLDETIGPPPLDSDSDGIADEDDNCVLVANVDQANADGDTFGDACDPCRDGPQSGVDADKDGVDDMCDPCPLGPNHDEDGDGLFDACDNCPGDANHMAKDDQTDSDGDGIGDACDPSNKTMDHRVFFDGFAPPDAQWNAGFDEWAGTGDAFAPTTMPSMNGLGAWNRRGEVDGRAWQVVTVVDLPAMPPNNMRVGLTTVQPQTTGPAPTCELYFDATDQSWHNADTGATVAVTSPLRVTMRIAPRADSTGPNTDLTCVFSGQVMPNLDGFFEAAFFPTLLLRNAVAEFRYVDVLQ